MGEPGVTKPAAPNGRACGACLHLDGEKATAESTRGLHYCWNFLMWRHPDEVVVDCSAATRASGAEPPGKIHFTGQRPKP